MNHALVLFSLLAAVATAAQAQTRVYRCGNTYTNDAAEAQSKGCKPIEGNNFTVIEGTRVQTPPTRVVAPASAAQPQQAAGSPAPNRVDSSEQRARDADARLILETELKRAETRQAELLKEYNNGEPEKLGPETRNHQKYLDRVAELKAAITRNEADIAGIRRELSRLTASR
ncbi:hypothetical protein JI739_22810 [Ramlibacter sp. AW1]|uniref:Uncharacterized protein n=1 Tax=Ramlibacter aurantiacus TaxID=2801330 RepID=A0A937D5Y3_9BURK|nr:hypothetical protein [Ramlibacter aurantiacus]MBL0423185.1 hypothetical protein [Ramlibacter aurantiacus]